MEKLLVKEVIAPIIIILLSILIYLIVSKVINKIFKLRIKKINNKKQDTIRKLVLNIVRYIIIILAVLTILEVYGIDTKSLIASLGVAGLVIGLSLQDMIKDFVAGTAIVLEDSYNIGDNVTINGFRGDVIELGVKTTKIKSYEGNLKIINNGSITEIINHSSCDSLAIIDVAVSYESNLKEVEKVLIDFCNKNTNIENIKELNMLGVQSLAESGIVFRITALCENGKHFAIKRELQKLIKLELDKHDIEIPYPHVMIKGVK